MLDVQIHFSTLNNVSLSETYASSWSCAEAPVYNCLHRPELSVDNALTLGHVFGCEELLIHRGSRSVILSVSKGHYVYLLVNRGAPKLQWTLKQTLEWIWLLHFPDLSTWLQEKKKDYVFEKNSFPLPPLSFLSFFYLFFMWKETYSSRTGELERGLSPAQTMEIYFCSR